MPLHDVARERRRDPPRYILHANRAAKDNRQAGAMARRDLRSTPEERPKLETIAAKLDKLPGTRTQDAIYAIVGRDRSATRSLALAAGPTIIEARWRLQKGACMNF